MRIDHDAWHGGLWESVTGATQEEDVLDALVFRLGSEQLLNYVMSHRSSPSGLRLFDSAVY